MKKLIAMLAIALIALPAVSEAGPIARLLRGGKNAGAAVLRKASHPFGACRGGSCGR